MTAAVQVVGIYRFTVHRITGFKRSNEAVRCYVVLSYGGQPMGKLAISELVYDMMRAGGAPLLPDR